MHIDIIIIVSALIFMLMGYRKGVVSTALASMLYLGSFLLAHYLNAHLPWLSLPLIGTWGNIAILFAILAIMSNYLVRLINFEHIIVLGMLSRLLGLLLYGALFTGVIIVIALVMQAFPGHPLHDYMADSVIMKYVIDLLASLDMRIKIPFLDQL